VCLLLRHAVAGGRRSAPDAVHVADRWHLLENCSAAVLDAVKRHMPAVRAAAKPTCDPAMTATVVNVTVADPAVPPPMTSAQRLQWESWQRRVRTHADAMGLHENGAAVRQIARELALSRNTVRRWLRGEQPELCRPRVHSLDPWRALLEQRWAEGCRNGAQLWRELRTAGFGGGLRVVTEWANRQRLAEPDAALTATKPSRSVMYPARRVARILTADPSSLTQPDCAYVEQLVRLSPTLAAVRDLARRFAALIRARAVEALTPWLAEAESSDLRGFAAGLRQDEQAVRGSPAAALEQRPGRGMCHPSQVGQAPRLWPCEARSAQGSPALRRRMTASCTEIADEPTLQADRWSGSHRRLALFTGDALCLYVVHSRPGRRRAV
jgi:transposase